MKEEKTYPFRQGKRARMKEYYRLAGVPDPFLGLGKKDVPEKSDPVEQEDSSSDCNEPD